MPKVFVFGIDSMDSILLSQFINRLPNFKKLTTEAKSITMNGVFPPDSATSWATVYTGLNPSRHGIFFFLDPLEKSHVLNEIDISNIVGKTFWDIASKNGKKVKIFFPLLGYPTWQVNGIMVGKSLKSNKVEISPVPNAPVDLSYLGGLKGLANMKPDRFIKKGKNLIKDETNFVLKHMNDEWDLIFFYSSVLDPIQHAFWYYSDKQDPIYPGKTKYENIIFDFYYEYDLMLGKILEKLNHSVILIVLSDHGHMRRPIKTVNIQELLRKRGYLFFKKSKGGKNSFIYKNKTLIMKLIAKFGIGNIALSLANKYSWIKESFSFKANIDWNHTKAYISGLSDLKAYTYGGIKIVRTQLEDNYENIREDIMNEIGKIKDPETGKDVLKWICRREDLYQGENLNKYPDILYELNEDYGAGWSPGNKLVFKSSIHQFQSGQHRRETPICFIRDFRQIKYRDKATLMDILPTILELLDIKENNLYVDGTSIIE